MTVAVVVSRADRASEHIGEQLLECADWEARVDEDRPDADGGGTYHVAAGFELRWFDDLHLHLGDPTPAFDADPELVVFVSRHSGETGALLTAHFTGNFGPAEYGGADADLARAAPNAQSVLLESFRTHAPEGYDVGIEGTHHGPTALSTPSLFAELGSGDDQWDDPEGARAVARAVLELEGVSPDRPGGGEGPNRHVVGFGGGHYAPRFGRIVAGMPWAVGHVASDWQLEELGDPAAARGVIDQAFRESAAEIAVIDGDHDDLAEVIANLGYRVVGETWVRTVGDRPLDLVDALEVDLSPVAAGLRFGDVAVDDPDAYRVVELPTELLAEAQGVDADAAREAVAGNAVAFETVESGTKAAGRAAVSAAADYDAMVDDLAAVLARSFDDVERRDGVVVAVEETFDPGKAATLGVPEGPKFGRLAAGEAVVVDGDTIPPGKVTSEHRVEFPV